MSIKDMKKMFINQSISTAAPQSGQTILIVFIMQYSVYKVCGSVHVDQYMCTTLYTPTY